MLLHHFPIGVDMLLHVFSHGVDMQTLSLKAERLTSLLLTVELIRREEGTCKEYHGHPESSSGIEDGKNVPQTRQHRAQSTLQSLHVLQTLQ